ncbi:MAG TPA: SirA family protein [Desulfotomaculum sp.]|nr:MAG: SirA-like domain-containing protein [Desulfotomaculum sp. 46_80]HAG10049.1 SirA family protein [Desulfotomaculum sp.]HBY04503.1 SirA family protein [Desulfotomaculum sp.]
MSIEVDARGLSCPEPVLMTMRQLNAISSGTIKVLVSNAAAEENVSRLAENKGWKVEVVKDGTDTILTLTK